MGIVENRLCSEIGVKNSFYETIPFSGGCEVIVSGKDHFDRRFEYNFSVGSTEEPFEDIVVNMVKTLVKRKVRAKYI